MGSIWQGTLAAFSEEIAAPQPAPAGVAVASVSAALGLSLLIKTLRITSRRSGVEKAPQELRIAAAQRLIDQLRNVADEDSAAVGRFLSSQDPEALVQAIGTPMQAAGVVAEGIGLCAEAAGTVRGLLAADAVAAALLLRGALRAILACVDFNLARQKSSDSAILAKRQQLERDSMRAVQQVLTELSESAGT